MFAEIKCVNQSFTNIFTRVSLQTEDGAVPQNDE